MKRLIILCLLLFSLLYPAAAVRANERAEGTEELKEPEGIEGTEETIDLIDTFYVLTARKDRTLHVPFNRSWFKGDARVYNHDLAKLSLGLATSAFRPNKQLVREGQTADQNLRSFLDQAGFSDLRSDDYDKDPSMYTVSTVIGHQTIGDGNDSFELIAVGICGQGYMDEWESNLSIGTGENPTGFYSASHLVYDRVFGYISENHLRGKMKIWISGFSRAAAVSNITASLLSDSDTFTQDNVFAYTFATPRTVRDSEPKVYENIFNICGKMDPVPNIPFADWGYSRYGITYFTPAIEMDSDFWEKRKKADEIYKDLTGISFWANPDMHSQLRVLMDCLLKICPDVETYHEYLQDDLISLWDKHDAVSIMTRLLKMADSPILTNEDNRQEANIMMNQIANLLLDYAAADNSFRRYNAEASVGSNFLQAHTPELYVSWVFSVDDPAALYSDSSWYSQLYVSGDTDVTISREGTILETLQHGDRDVGSYQYLGVRDDKISVLIPGDRDYNVFIRSNRDQTVEALEAVFQAGRQSPQETMTYTSDMHAGDEMNIGYTSSGKVMIPEGSFTTTMKYESERDLTRIELMLNVYSNSYNVSWRDMVLIVLMGAVLLTAFVLFIITLLSMWIRYRYQRNRGIIPTDARFSPLPVICFFLIQQVFLAKELITALFEPDPETTIGFKIVIGVLILIIAFYGYLRRRDRYHLLILIAVLMLTGADVMMTTSVAAGALFYIGAYALLCVNFVRADRPGVIRILIWIALSAAGTCFMMRLKGDYGYLRFIAILYVITGAALVVTAFTHSARTSRGSFLLVAAGIMIALNTARGDNFLLHFISAGLHYNAAYILASTGSSFFRGPVRMTGAETPPPKMAYRNNA